MKAYILDSCLRSTLEQLNIEFDGPALESALRSMRIDQEKSTGRDRWKPIANQTKPEENTSPLGKPKTFRLTLATVLYDRWLRTSTGPTSTEIATGNATLSKIKAREPEMPAREGPIDSFLPTG